MSFFNNIFDHACTGICQFLRLVVQAMAEIMLQGLKIMYPNNKSESPMLTVAMTCLKYIVPEQ